MNRDTTLTDRGDVSGLPADRLEGEIVGLARRLSAGTYELLVLLGELDVRGTWARWGALSCAAWLADACDIEASTARTQVRVARALRTFAALDTAMASGDVSFAKARVLVPHLCADNAGDLVELSSRTPAGQLGAAIAAWSLGHDDPADIERRQHNERSTTWRTDADGMVTLTVRLPPAAAAAVCAVIDQVVRTNHAPAGAPLRHQRADALVGLLTGGNGDEVRASGNGGPAGTVTAEIVVHIRGDRPAHLADGTPLSDNAVTALLGDAFVSLLVHDMEGRPIDASPRRRQPTRRQRRVIDERHPRCNHPGCRATRFLHYDHDEPYALGGPTVLANLQRLCGPHNRAKEHAR